MANKKLCVVTPVHKPTLTNEEKISLQACYRHLKEYDCFLVFPENMPVSSYFEVHPEIILKPVPLSWLASVESYNRMKTTLKFYELFRDYQFLMTYEPDAYIFNSAIEKYFGYDFDFIGAPMFSYNGVLIPGLNSGFSIRNIKACVKALQALEKFRSRWKLYRFFFWNIPFAKNIMSPNNKFIIKDAYLKAFYRGGYFHEDFIFTKIIPVIWPEFTVAPMQKALQFSFEVNPGLLYEMNDHKLPLGCHAWPKFLSFWKDHIANIQNV